MFLRRVGNIASDEELLIISICESQREDVDTKLKLVTNEGKTDSYSNILLPEISHRREPNSTIS